MERLGEPVLPKGSWLDEGHGCAAALAPVPECVGDALRPVTLRTGFDAGKELVV